MSLGFRVPFDRQRWPETVGFVTRSCDPQGLGSSASASGPIPVTVLRVVEAVGVFGR